MEDITIPRYPPHNKETPKIRYLGFYGHECNNSMHFASIYETDQERDTIIFGFLHQGIVNHDINLYCPTERTAQDFQDKFTAMYPEDACHLDKPDYLVLSMAQQLYYPNGQFSVFEMDQNLEAFWVESWKNGKRNVRATAEIVWALEIHANKIELMAYESRLNYIIPGKSWISICMYNLTKFDGKTIMQVLQTHPYTIGKRGQITKNPFYMDPDQWLAQHAPDYMNIYFYEVSCDNE